jgi:hypothetical protein
VSLFFSTICVAAEQKEFLGRHSSRMELLLLLVLFLSRQINTRQQRRSWRKIDKTVALKSVSSGTRFFHVALQKSRQICRIILRSYPRFKGRQKLLFLCLICAARDAHSLLMALGNNFYQRQVFSIQRLRQPACFWPTLRIK